MMKTFNKVVTKKNVFFLLGTLVGITTILTVFFQNNGGSLDQVFFIFALMPLLGFFSFQKIISYFKYWKSEILIQSILAAYVIFQPIVLNVGLEIWFLVTTAVMAYVLIILFERINKENIKKTVAAVYMFFGLILMITPGLYATYLVYLFTHSGWGIL